MAANFTYGGNDPSQTYYYGNNPTNINSVSPNVNQSAPTTSSSTTQIPYIPPPIYNVPLTQTASSNSNNGNNSGKANSGQQTIFAPPPTFAPPPSTPNFAQLQKQLAAVQRQDAINKAMADYDALSASTKASGFQAANNAGSTYAQRLMQQGINPSASGVVAAQAKLPVYGALASIEQQKDQTRLTATNQSQALAAQISGQIQGLKLNYANMLADYNSKNTGYNLDLNKFNAGQALNQEQYQTDTYFKQQQLDAQRAAATAAAGQAAGRATGGANINTLTGSGVANSFSPGYIPNSGPIIPSVVNGVPQFGRVAVGY